MAIALVDICNTLADVNSVIYRELGPSPSPYIYRHPKVDLQYFKDNLWVFKSARPIEGSTEALNRLAEGFEIVYLTARPKESKLITQKWLKDHGYPKGKIVFSQDKGLDALKFGAQLAIDDAPHELERLHKIIPCLLKHNRIYNQDSLGLGFEWIDFLQDKKEVSSTVFF